MAGARANYSFEALHPLKITGGVWAPYLHPIHTNPHTNRIRIPYAKQGPTEYLKTSGLYDLALYGQQNPLKEPFKENLEVS